MVVNTNLYVVRYKNTTEYKRNSGCFRDINDTKCKSEIKFFKTEALARSSVRGYCMTDEDLNERFEIVPVEATIIGL